MSTTIPRMAGKLSLAVFAAAMLSFLTPNTATAGEQNGKMDGKAILLSVFGTSVEGADAPYSKLQKDIGRDFPDYELVMAYNSRIIREKLKKEGIFFFSPSETLNHLLDAGYSSIKVLAVYITAGQEYEKLQQDAVAFKDKAEISLTFPPLYNTETTKEFCAAVLTILPAERKADEAVLFMGHGNPDGRSDAAYKTAAAMLSADDKNIHLACVEGAPAFDDALAALKASGVKKVWLMPFMIVAGDHAQNDLAGSEDDSWKSLLEAQGFECTAVLKGLCEYEEIAQYFTDLLKK